MQLTAEQITHIATLARLSLTPQETQTYAHQLSVILEYVEMLNEINTDEISETCQVTGLEDVFRDDVANVCPDDVREKLLAAFPKRAGRLLQVQAVFESSESDE